MKSNLLMTHRASAWIAPVVAVVVSASLAGACASEEGRSNDDTPGSGSRGDVTAPTGEQAAPVGDASKSISKTACLRKMALDFTNAAPSKEELEAVRTGAKSLDQMADGYLASEKFAGVVFDWFRDEFQPTEKTADAADKEEPARLARYIVVNDVDFRDLVAASYTVGASDSKEAGKAWSSGVLGTQAYLSAFTGIENRNWAGHLLTGMTGVVLEAIAEVPAGVDASKEGTAANPACAGCHTHPIYGVDRAAAFRDCFDAAGIPIAACAPKGDLPFLGQTGKTLPDLGKILAGSVEWRAAMIQLFYERLGGRPIGKNELPQYRAYEEAWLAANYKPKTLLKQIVTSKQYCSR